MRTERRKWLAVFALFFTIALALLIVAFLHSTPNVHADGLEPDCDVGPGNCGCWLYTLTCYQHWREYSECGGGLHTYIQYMGWKEYYVEGVRSYSDQQSYTITSYMATPPPDAGNICETTCG